MHIKIAQRYRPFTHIPGAYTLLPGTSLRFQIFPALIKVDDLSGTFPISLKDIPVNIDGPVEDFTVLQDLEKKQLVVWGNTASGYMRYKIIPDLQSGFLLKWEKIQEGSSHPKIEAQDKVLSEPELFSERLSLGSHKAQNWEKISQRNDMSDIFPLWLRLGNVTPSAEWACEGSAAILQSCAEAIKSHDIQHIAKTFRKAYLAGFENGLSPSLIDTKHQGFHLPALTQGTKSSPLVFLTEGAKLIRSLFIQHHDGKFDILPALPVEFHCGRFIQMSCGDSFMLDMEWSKKLIRRIVLYPTKNTEAFFHFQKGIKRFRLRKDSKDRGHLIDCNTPLMIEAGQRLFFDRFEQ